MIFLTGHDHTGLSPEGIDWAAVGKAAGMIVLYMAMRHMGEIADKLIAGGLAADTPVAVVMNASLPEMRVLDTTLARAAADIAASGMGAPAIVSNRARERAARADGMALKGLIIAAPSSGAGKTVVTLGLASWALRRQGVDICSAKSGPDYIDPAFHAAATGKACINLDAWAMPPTALRAMAHRQPSGLLLIEGAMGLFDAAPVVGNPMGKGSVADLAEVLDLPVVLVVDVARQAQTVAAVVAGAGWVS